LVQDLSQGKEVEDVGSGILKGLGGEWAPPPVSPLESLTLMNSYAQQVFDKGRQAKLGNAGKAGSDAGIVQVTDTEPVIPIQAADIVVRAMNNFTDGIICQNFFEGSELLQGYRIYDIDFVAGSDLNEAELLRVVVKAIRLGIKSDGP